MKIFAVIGLGQFGHHVAVSLAEAGGDVIAVDSNEERVDRIKDDVGQAVCMDATKEGALRAIGLDRVTAAVVALGELDLEASVLVAAELSDLGVSRIVARAATSMQARILQRVGATEIVFPEKEMGEQMGQNLLMSGVVDQVQLSTGQRVAQVRPLRSLIGKTLVDAALRQNFGLNVIGTQLPSREVDDHGEVTERLVYNDAPGPNTVIEEDMILTVVGDRDNIFKIARED